MKKDVNEIINEVRKMTERHMLPENTPKRDDRVAWYWSYTGMLDMAFELGLITNIQRLDFYSEVHDLKKVAMQPDVVETGKGKSKNRLAGLYKRIIKVNGENEHSLIAAEKMAGLAKEIMRWQRKYNSIGDLARAIAEAEIMLESLRLVFESAEELIDDEKRDLLEQLEEAVEEQEVMQD